MGSFYSTLGAFVGLSIFKINTIYNFDRVDFILKTGYIGLSNRLLNHLRTRHLKEQPRGVYFIEDKINDFLSGALSICETISIMYFYDKIFY
jgi:hypothetical protein